MEMLHTKFKGKEADNWRYGHFIQHAKLGYSMIAYVNLAELGPVRPETICQFTGLIDNHSNEIYPDDILETPDGNRLRVYGTSGGFVIKAWAWAGDLSDLVPGDDLIFEALSDPQVRSFIDQCKVIGNIYDNPQIKEV